MKFLWVSGAKVNCATLLLATTLLVRSVPSEPEISPGDLPRVKPVEPGQALATFQLKAGYRMELAAAEPLVMDPIALSFDENGRLFVVEMRDYSERRDEQLGRIRLLEDTDGDGRFDKATVYAENLAWPSALIVYDGGVFVGATPDILFLKDTDGDGKADTREVVFTGFGAGVRRLNVQQLVNSFAWGLDDRIHGANGGNGGSITSPLHPQDPPLELRGHDFSFDPRTRTIRPESGGGQYGMTFDSYGRKFVCSNSSHIRAVRFEDRYVGRNPALAMPPPSIDIAVDGPAAEVYRISPEEPWRVLRTQWRVAGLVPGPIEGGGRASGYFTSATGITIYRGDALPEEFEGNAFIADCGSNLLHRKRVLPDGSGFRAERPADEAKVEFLASRDVWFRPVQMANGPDGALYVIDMYREIIEHPWSFPASIKKYLDLNSGNNRGRIYRVVPEQFRRREVPHLSGLSTVDLVSVLEHRNGWHRDTAARLLYQRQDPAALPALRQLLQESKSDLGRMHALASLHGLSQLRASDITLALVDPAPAVRRLAVRFLEDLEKPAEAASVGVLRRLATDPDLGVLYQLAFTLGIVAPADRVDLLRLILRADATDPWMRLAVLNSAGDQTAELFARLVESDHFALNRSAEPILRQLMTLIGARHQRPELDRALDISGKLDSAPLACSLSAALGEGVLRAGGALWRSSSADSLELLLQKARQLLKDEAAPPESRSAALRVLGQARFASVRNPLRALLAPDQPVALQGGAVETLANFSEPEVAGDLLDAWAGLTPQLRRQVVAALLRRPERLEALVASLESGQLHPSDLSASQVEFLRQRPDAPVRERAMRVLGRPPTGTRREVVQARSGALSYPGDLARGAAIYLERCATCHRLGGQGHALGPDLESVRSSGNDLLLANILDPNREVIPKYINYLAETKDGESYSGLVIAESESTVVLRQPNDVETVLLRSNIQQMRSLGQSAMPEGLEEGLADQALADLLEYVLTARSAQP